MAAFTSAVKTRPPAGAGARTKASLTGSFVPPGHELSVALFAFPHIATLARAVVFDSVRFVVWNTPSSLRVTGSTRWREVRDRIIQFIAIKMVHANRAFESSSLPLHPDQELAAPVTRMRSFSNLIVESSPSLGHQPGLASKRVALLVANAAILRNGLLLRSHRLIVAGTEV